ncbi:MAG TPA: hypothetical protein VFG86_11635 [Chloroflexota bacterium]|nr:hypothetical protein [Chloroflexota bacterium]
MNGEATRMNYLQLENLGRYRQDALLSEAANDRLADALRSTIFISTRGRTERIYQPTRRRGLSRLLGLAG